MNEWASGYPGIVVTLDAGLEREFSERLAESSTLAVRVAYGVLRRKEDAEEVAQEAFVRAYQRFAQLRDRDRFRAWLVRMTWRLAIDRWRTDRRRERREQRLDTPEEHTPEQAAAVRERAAHLWRAVDDLPPKLRIVVILAAIQGYEVGEVARLLEVPEGTVKSRLFLARRRLAEKLRCLANDSPRP